MKHEFNADSAQRGLSRQMFWDIKSPEEEVF